MLAMTSAAMAAIRQHAQHVYPDECCGALVGGEGTVVEAFALPNRAVEGARTRFLVSPADYRAAEARARQHAASLVGFYHSHPDHPAAPSLYDLEHAWPWFAYVIVAVRQGRPGEMTAWRLREDRTGFDEVPMSTVDEREVRP